MPKYTVEIPGRGSFDVESPTELTDYQAYQAVLSQIGPAPEQKTGIGGALMGGFERLLSTGRTGIESLFDPEAAAKAGAERQQAISERYAPGTDLEAVKQAYEERGLLPAAGEALSQIPAALAEQFPNMAAAFASGRAGAIAGGRMFGPRGALVGGLTGVVAPSLGQLYGAGLERQADEGAEISRGRALAAAVPGAALETAATFIPLGRSLVGKILGPQAEEALKAGQRAGVERVAKESLLGTAARGTVVGAGLEVPTEVIQQMLERAQAGLDITSDDALAEYGQAAYGAALVGGPFGAVGRVGQRSVARGELEQESLRQQQEEQRLAAEQARAEQEAEAARKLTPEYRRELNDQIVASSDELRALEQQLKDKTLDKEVKDELKARAGELRKQVTGLNRQMEEAIKAAGLETPSDMAAKRKAAAAAAAAPQTVVDDFGNVLTPKKTALTAEEEAEGYERQAKKTLGYYAEREQLLEKLREEDQLRREKADADLQTSVQNFLEGMDEVAAQESGAGVAFAQKAAELRKAGEEKAAQEMTLDRIQLVLDKFGTRVLGLSPDETVQSLEAEYAKRSDPKAIAAAKDREGYMRALDGLRKDLENARKKVSDTSAQAFTDKINNGVIDRNVTSVLGIKGLGGKKVSAVDAMENLNARARELEEARQKALVDKDPLMLDNGQLTKKGYALVATEAKLNEIKKLLGIAQSQAPAETGTESAIEGTLKATVAAEVESPAIAVEQGLPRVAYETKIKEANQKATGAFEDLLGSINDLQKKRFFGGAPGQIGLASSTEEGLQEQVKEAKGRVIDGLLEEVATERVARKLRPLSKAEAYLFVEDIAGLVDTLVERSLAAAPGMQTETVTTPGQMRGTRLVSGATETEVDTRTERQLPFGAAPRSQDAVASMSEKDQQELSESFDRLYKNVRDAKARVTQIDDTLNVMQPPKPVAKKGEPAPEPVRRRVILPESPEAQRLADERVKAVAALRKAEQALANARVRIKKSVKGVSEQQAIQTIRNVIRSIKESTVAEGQRPTRVEKPILRQQFKTQPDESQIEQGERVVDQIERVLSGDVDPEFAAMLNEAADIIANRQANPTFLNTVDEQVDRILRGTDKADSSAALFREIKQDLEIKAAERADTGGQADMFAEERKEFVTERATPANFQRYLKSKEVQAKRDALAQTEQLKKDLRAAKRMADAETAKNLADEERTIFEEITKLADNIKRGMGDKISALNARKFASLDDRIKKLVADYKKRSGAEVLSEVVEGERILNRLLEDVSVDIAAGSEVDIRLAEIKNLKKKIAELTSYFKKMYEAGVSPSGLESIASEIVEEEKNIARLLRVKSDAEPSTRAPITAAERRKAVVALMRRIDAVLKTPAGAYKPTLAEKNVTGLSLSGLRFERKSLEEIAADLTEARKAKRAAEKKANAKTKEEKDKIKLKVKSKFKVARLEQVSVVPVPGTVREDLESGQFAYGFGKLKVPKPKLQPKGSRTKEEIAAAAEERKKDLRAGRMTAEEAYAKFSEDAARQRKALQKAEDALLAYEYGVADGSRKDNATTHKGLINRVDKTRAMLRKTLDFLGTLRGANYDPEAAKTTTASRTVQGPITESEKRVIGSQVFDMLGYGDRFGGPRTYSVDDTIDFAVSDEKPATPVDFDAAEKRLKEVKKKVDAMIGGKTPTKKPEVDLTRRRLVQAAGVALATPKMPASIVKAFNVAELTPDAVWKAVTSGSGWFDSIVDGAVEKLSKSDSRTFINLKGSALYDAMERIAGKEAAVFIDSLEYADPIDVYLGDFIEANKNDPQILSKIQRGYDVAATDVFKEIAKRLKDEQKAAKDTAVKQEAKGAEFNFYRSLADAPEAITEAMIEQGLDPLKAVVKGGVMPDGSVFVIVDAHTDMLDLEQTLVHELVGHYSFESMLGTNGMEKLMLKLDKDFSTNENESGLENLADQLGVRKEYNGALVEAYEFFKERLDAGEISEKDVRRQAKTKGLREIIAYTMEKRVSQSFYQKAQRFIKEIVGAIRAALKNFGLLDASKMTTSDLFYLMKQANDNFTAGKPMAYRNADGSVSFRGTAASAAPKTGLDGMLAQPGSKLFDTVKANVMGLGFRTQFLDRLAALDALVKKGVSVGVIDSLKAMDVMYFSRMADQRNNFVADFATNGVGKIEEKNGERMYVGGNGPSLRDVSEALRGSGIDPKLLESEFTKYLLALRANQVGLSKLDYSGSVTQAEVDATIAKYKNNAAFEKARKLYAEYNNNLVDFVASTGAISKARAASMKNKDYVPFYRKVGDRVELVIDKETYVRIGDFKNQPYLRELVGGEDKVLPVFTSSLQNTQLLVDMALKNMATRNTAYVLADMGVAEVRKGDGRADPNTIRFKRDGEDFHAVVNVEAKKDLFGEIPTELVVKGMEGINASIPAVIRMMGVPANILRKFVTRNPKYAVNQIFRDSMAAVMTTGADFVPVVDTMKQLVTMNKKGLTKTLQGRGVLGGQVITGASDDMSKIMNQIATGKAGWTLAMAKLDELAQMGDAATRVSMYNSFLRQGLSEREATFATLEAMNFSRRGLSPSVMFASTIIPFFNANLQGLDVLWRAWKGDMPASERLRVRNKLISRGMMMAAMTMIYAAAMTDDETYENANPDERYSNWFVPTPAGTFRVPIPFELGFFFKAVPEGVVRLMMSDDKGEDVMSALAGMTFKSVPGDLPTAIKAPIELMLNKSFFTGRPIVDQRLEGLKASEQYRPNTPELVKMFGAVGLSPVQVEYAIRAYTGSLPIALLRAVDPVFAGGEVVKPEMKLEETPVIGSFFQPKDAGGLINAAYERVTSAQSASNTYKNMIAEGRTADAKKFLEENLADVSLASAGGAFRQQMGEITKAERAIRASDLPPEEKRKRLDEMRQVKIQLAKQFTSVSEQIKAQTDR